ncbi:MAG: FHA domain-containing protein [Deltaproteobacteria bacterium]|nr:FHA domain-containing protein [Deltaproteobacteria bacterium]MBN2687779.1 FHA domain-containing protein [Deltaproteobacteria bacterium]
MAKILLKFKDAVLKEIPLEKEVITIGRKEGNDVVIDNIGVSGFHAKIVREGDYYAVEDMNSLNGTFVDGKKISKVILDSGNVILVGKHTLEFISEMKQQPEQKTQQMRGISMDETMVIAPLEQEKILASTEKLEVLGGFIVVEGSTDMGEYELKDRVTTIGKDDSALIKLKGFFAPKIAALVNRRKEGYFISPSGKKPLKINGEEIDHRYDLKDGDIVEVAGVKMQFYVKD